MYYTQALLGLMMAGFMATASAIGPGDLGNLSGQTFTIGNSLCCCVTIDDEYRFDILPASAAIGTASRLTWIFRSFRGRRH